MVVRSIESALKKLGYCGPLTINAFGNLEDIHDDVLRTYSSTGIVMKHDPFMKSSNCTECDVEGREFSSIMPEVRRWLFSNQAPTSVVIISNPECAYYFHFHITG
ncbi:hypothetical protein DY000_02032394 [Brassica cretica]|uniref:NYN domain-containing protein n=1 Tax=Brassica cretica TaxID=69181 RepID=A0ABQ7DVJ6_BRACR|nr:hypothetical protein DY000_02032394 [Brassica cretica]